MQYTLKTLHCANDIELDGQECTGMTSCHGVDPVCGPTGQPIHTPKCMHGTGSLVQAVASKAEFPHSRFSKSNSDILRGHR